MRHRAFSVVELLVVIAVLAILLGLILPAIQSSREAARNVHCKNNLKQIGTACLQYESFHGMYPPGVNGSSTFNSFLATILPYLGEEALYESIDRNWRGTEPAVHEIQRRAMPKFMCPSENSKSPYEGARTSYAGNYSTGWQKYGPDGMFRALIDLPDDIYKGGPIRVQNVPDGLSNTVMVSEWLPIGYNKPRLRKVWEMPVPMERPEELDDFADYCAAIPPDPEFYGWRDNGGMGGTWIIGSYPDAKYNHVLTPNQPSCSHGGGPTSAYTAGSNHHQGINVVYADGHVKFIADAIARNVWRDLGSRGETGLRY